MVRVGSDHDTVSSRLKKARKMRKLSQIEVMQRTGISNKSLSAYEAARNGIELDVLQKLANCYDVTVDWLLGKTNDPGASFTEEERRLVEGINFSDEELVEEPMYYFGRELDDAEKKRVLSVVRALLDSSRQDT
ncbi:helix-turn-helix domain-containing protein [Cohnella sp. OV330]|uniref:helix-turn-helix domain-containing protein n=1 Tax=Cohnella sp. OV330 TaxID=1855288 RepID=UPI0013146241|nr:helix-turn-helix transcriptional regulator [Cohnella sp. OV330]